MNWLTRLFSRSDDDADNAVLEVYRIGLRDGMDAQERAHRLYEQALALKTYPDPDHINVYSLKEAARRFAQYKPREPAA